MASETKDGRSLAVSPVIPSLTKEKRVFYFSTNFAFQFTALLWIAPIIAVLILNLKGVIVGAGLSCLVRSCDVVLDSNELQQLNQENRNITGALQLVAKALEIWFGVIAGGVVYDLTMYLATTGDGLPLFYLSTPLNLSPGMLVSKSFWLSALKPPRMTTAEDRGDNRKWTVRLFILFVVVVLFITTLMGPATAVLLLPALGWQTIPGGQPLLAFFQLDSASPPPSFCFPTIYTTSYPDITCHDSAPTLDLLFLDMALNYQDTTPVLDFSDISYSFNYTGGVIYSPTQQALRGLLDDYHEWTSCTYSDDTSYAEISKHNPYLTEPAYKAMRKAQQTQRLRKAPAFLTSSLCFDQGSSVVEIGNDMAVRCYNMPYPESPYNSIFWPSLPVADPLANLSTRCIREGSGWPAGSNNHSSFFIGTGNSSSPLQVNTYTSDRAVFLNTTTRACLANGTICDWNAMFTEDPDPILRNASINAQITEYSQVGYDSLNCHTLTYLRFPTYIVESNNDILKQPLSSMRDEQLTVYGTPSDQADPIMIHPNWTLVAWGVDENGTVNATRDTAVQFVQVFHANMYVPTFHTVAAAQGQYYISYSTTNANLSSNSTSNPTLDTNIVVYSWSYGLGSHTAKLGAVVAILGCVLVLAKFAIGLIVRVDKRSFHNLFLGALMQAPPQLIEDISNQPQEEIVKKRFHMEDGKWPEFQFRS